MKISLKRTLSLLLVLVFLVSLVSCGKEEPTTQTDEETVTAVPTEETKTDEKEPEIKLPEYMNPLTGLACDPSLVGKRPMSVVLNNHKDALPQSGLSKYDIVCEALAEGGILRMEGVVLDYMNVGRVGSIRSARPYLVELSLAFDSIFVHAGGSSEGYEAISTLHVNDVDGVKNGPFNVNGTAIFWRDQDRLKKGYAYEHTMFTSGANVKLAADSKNYRQTLSDPKFTAFAFDPAFDGLKNQTTATYIKIPHSTYSTSEFTYKPEDGLYYHSDYQKPHVDGENGAQLATKNVFILFTQQGLYDSNSGKRNIQLTGEGTGYYFVGGEYTPIVWKRESRTGAFTYQNADGSELKVACGRSFISIVDIKTKNSLTIS